MAFNQLEPHFFVFSVARLAGRLLSFSQFHDVIFEIFHGIILMVRIVLVESSFDGVDLQVTLGIAVLSVFCDFP